MNILSVTLGKLIPKYRTVEEWSVIYERILESKPISDKTRANRLAYVKRVVAEFGARSIGSIRPHDVSEFISKTTRNSPSAARKILIETRAMFREAIDYDWLVKDPTTYVKSPKQPVLRQRLTFQQWKIIHDWAAENSPPWVPIMFTLALITGQRRSDLRNMKFSDVWEEQTKSGPKQYLHIIQSKTGERIAIPLSLYMDALDTDLGSVIESARNYRPFPVNEDSFMIRKSTGDQPVGASMSWRFEQAREESGAAQCDKPPCLHECRSLAARLYDEQGIRDIQTLLGHTNAAMTEIYKDDRGLDRRQGKWRTVELNSGNEDD